MLTSRRLVLAGFPILAILAVLATADALDALARRERVHRRADAVQRAETALATAADLLDRAAERERAARARTLLEADLRAERLVADAVATLAPAVAHPAAPPAHPVRTPSRTGAALLQLLLADDAPAAPQRPEPRDPLVDLARSRQALAALVRASDARLTVLDEAGAVLWHSGDAPAALNVSAAPAPDAAASKPDRQDGTQEADERQPDVRRTAAQPANAWEAGARQTAAGQADAGQADAGQTDAGQTAAGQTAAGQADAGLVDAGLADAGQVAAGQVAAGQVAAGQVDAGQADAGLAGAGQADARGAGAGEAGVRTGVQGRRVAERELRFPVGAETRTWTVRGTVPIDRPAPATVSAWARSAEAAPLLRRWFAGGGVRLALLDAGLIRAVLPAGADWPTGLREGDIGRWRTVPADTDAADGPLRMRHLASQRLPAHPQLRLVALTDTEFPPRRSIALEAIQDRPALALVPGVALLAGLAGLVWGLARREPRHRQAKPRLVRRGPREAPEDAPLLVADFDRPDEDAESEDAIA
ncbi:MAG: hypothetical protein ACOCX4_10070, partial [Planctomycetota bacterium]